MTVARDAELTRALERGQVADEGFHHASHLRVACVYLDEAASVDEAGGRMAATLRRCAASAGHAEKYHHTLTIFWMRLLAAARAADRDVDAVLRAYPRLLDKELPRAYYSRERLFGDAARTLWVDPDLRPLTIDALTPGATDSSRDAPNRPVSRGSP
jgi:hypothetical protein